MRNRFKMKILAFGISIVALMVFVGCTKEVVKEVPTEVVVTKEVIKEVPVEVVVEREIVKQVEVPVTQVVVADLDPGELVIYSGRKESLVGALIEDFENLTGVDVQVKYGKTFPVATMILEEGDNSPADIYFAQDPGGLGFLSAEGRLIKLPESITASVADW